MPPADLLSDDPAIRRQVEAWAASGAMALTGWPDRDPLGPPLHLVDRVAAVADRLAGAAPDPLALLGERAAVLDLHRQGRTSCGGSARLLPTAEGWLVLNLARPDDLELLPAWLGCPVDDDDVWEAVATAVLERRAADLVIAADGLGLPVAVVAAPGEPAPWTDLPVGWTGVDGPSVSARAEVDGLRVIDLTSLWAGPLCGSLLAALGADVVKVESTGRPDGARLGPVPFFDLLNAGKRSVALDFGSEAGRAALHELVASADVVLEASRPRALGALGVDADASLATGPRAWVSITGHGRGLGQHRVAFGDDAAAAGGLVAQDHSGDPVFCADAVADPLAGLVAAAAALEAVARGGRWLVDVSMTRVGEACSGATLPVAADLHAASPRARCASGPGPALGEHTDAILGALR